MRRRLLHALGALFAMSTLLCSGLSAADPIADFYRGKSISIYVGSEAGGGYDVYARLLARHIGKHIPGNPTVVVRNMPGSGGLTMTNFIANIGPKDGTAIGTAQSTIAFEALLHLNSVGGKAAQFEAEKLSWLGSTANSVFLVAAWHTAKPKTFTDLLTTELVLGTSGQRTDGALITAALNKVVGTKIKHVPGYQSGSRQVLALERGEIDAAALEYSTISAMRPDWIKDGKLRFLVQCGLKPHPDLTYVPFALDFVTSPEDRAALTLIFAKYEFGRPFYMAAEVPTERVKALQTAFDESMKDPDLLADARKQNLHIGPMPGPALQATIETLYRSPPPIRERARDILGAK